MSTCPVCVRNVPRLRQGHARVCPRCRAIDNASTGGSHPPLRTSHGGGRYTGTAVNDINSHITAHHEARQQANKNNTPRRTKRALKTLQEARLRKAKADDEFDLASAEVAAAKQHGNWR